MQDEDPDLDREVAEELEAESEPPEELEYQLWLDRVQEDPDAAPVEWWEWLSTSADADAALDALVQRGCPRADVLQLLRAVRWKASAQSVPKGKFAQHLARVKAAADDLDLFRFSVPVVAAEAEEQSQKAAAALRGYLKRTELSRPGVRPSTLRDEAIHELSRLVEHETGRQHHRLVTILVREVLGSTLSEDARRMALSRMRKKLRETRPKRLKVVVKRETPGTWRKTARRPAARARKRRREDE